MARQGVKELLLLFHHHLLILRPLRQILTGPTVVELVRGQIQFQQPALQVKIKLISLRQPLLETGQAFQVTGRGL